MIENPCEWLRILIWFVVVTGQYYRCSDFWSTRTDGEWYQSKSSTFAPMIQIRTPKPRKFRDIDVYVVGLQLGHPSGFRLTMFWGKTFQHNSIVTLPPLLQPFHCLPSNNGWLIQARLPCIGFHFWCFVLFRLPFSNNGVGARAHIHVWVCVNRVTGWSHDPFILRNLRHLGNELTTRLVLWREHVVQVV